MGRPASHYSERRIIQRMRRRRREAARQRQKTDKVIEALFYIFLFLSILILGFLVAYLLI